MTCTCKTYDELRGNKWVTIAETCRRCEPESMEQWSIRQAQEAQDFLYPTTKEEK